MQSEKMSETIMLKITKNMRTNLKFCEDNGYPITSAVIRQAIQKLINKRMTLIGAENE